MTEAGQPAEVLCQGRFIRMMSRNGWEFVEHPHIRGIVVLVAVTPARELLLVEQYREPLQRRVLELPAGMVGDHAGGRDEPMEVAARRELLEETGYEAGRMTHLMAGPYSPGRSSDLYTFYLASDLCRVHEGGGDEHEDIVVHHMPLHGADAWLDRAAAGGLLLDAKIYAGLYFAGRGP